MSRQSLSPYVNFQGRAREAMEFYRAVFGGTLDLQAATDKGALKPAGPADRIMHARLDADGVVIIGTDGHPDYPPTVGDNMAIALGGREKERLAKIFSGLADGGRTKMPLTEQPSGAATGWLTDKYGINWMVSLETA